MVRRSVVLPQPLGPSSVKNSPGAIVSSMPSRAFTPGNDFEIPSSRIEATGRLC